MFIKSSTRRDATKRARRALLGCLAPISITIGVVLTPHPAAAQFMCGGSVNGNEPQSGGSAILPGTNAVVCGPQSAAVVRGSAFGDQSTALGEDSSAFGYRVKALADFSSAFGSFSEAYRLSSAFGEGAKGGGFGLNNNYDTAIGAFAEAGSLQSGQDNATAIGGRAWAYSAGGTAIGAFAYVQGLHATSIGAGPFGPAADGDYSIAIGRGTDTDFTPTGGSTIKLHGAVAYGFISTAIGTASA